MLRPAQVDRYLARIGYSGDGSRAPGADLRTLFGLQRAHLLTVPFENLDIRRGVRLALDPAALFDKIVERRRGGFCHELNRSFAGLLEAIGFRPEFLAARVYTGDGSLGPAYGHLALRVGVGAGHYLVDVGFGDSFVRPLRLDRRRSSGQGLSRFRVEAADGDGYVLVREALDGTSETARYRFDRTPSELPAFEATCRFQQTSPESHFTRQTICSRSTPDGRISLADDRLIETRGAARFETLLDGPADLARALAVHFGIVMIEASSCDGLGSSPSSGIGKDRLAASGGSPD